MKIMKMKSALIYFAGVALALSPIIASADTALSTTCAGVPATSSITWTASSAGGVAPIAFLWGNSATSSVQTVAVTPGTYSMTIQATDASSTVATSTCSATVSQPTTPPDGVKSQIQNLLNQIAALRAQLEQLLRDQRGSTGTTTPPVILPPGQCLKINRDLHRGDDGDDVRELQRNLSQDPSVFPEGNVTGFFGPQTEKAVKRFQEKHGIFSNGTTTGFFGPLSRGKYWEQCTSSTTPRIMMNNRGEDEGRGEDGNHRNGNSTSTPRIMMNNRGGDDRGDN